MQRIGHSFGPLDYQTSHIPTLGASNSAPHQTAINRVNKMAETIRQNTRK